MKEKLDQVVIRWYVRGDCEVGVRESYKRWLYQRIKEMLPAESINPEIEVSLTMVTAPHVGDIDVVKSGLYLLQLKMREYGRLVKR